MNRSKTIASLAIVALLGIFAPSSVWAQSLDNDAFVSAEITRTGQLDPYTFTATVGDLVYITVADRDNTSLTPSMRLFDPAGIQVRSDTDIRTAIIYAYEVLSSGQHSITVQDSGADDLGRYSLYFVRMPGGNELGRLSNDARLAGTLELGDLDTFTFDAVAGERIHLNVADKNNTSFTPFVSIFNPSGSLVVSDTDIRTATIRNLEITTTGVWSVLVTDSASDDAADYDLFFTKIPGSNEKGLLPNDARRSADLALGDIDTWAFDAQVGDRIHLNVTDINNTSVTPDLLLYGPDGSLVASDVDIRTATINGYSVTQAGRYVAVVRDSAADDAGTYELYFAKASGAREGGVLSGNTALQGTLDLGDIDTFEYGAVTGSTVILNVGDIENTSLTPQVRVYFEDGTLVISDTDIRTATLSLVTPNTGFYTVVVQDSAADDAGIYSLDFVYIGATPPVRTRSVVLEPNIWHLLGVPGSTGGTLGELFSSGFDLASYDNASSPTGWVMFGFETDTLDATTGSPGVYRKLSLSEPVPQGTGLWLLHLNTSAIRVNLPITATDAAGSIGGGCASGSACISTPLATAPTGSWTIGAVPSTLVPQIDSFRFLTDTQAPVCTQGCDLQQAADAGYAAPNGVFVYESLSERYRILTGVDSVAPWTGFWVRANAPATPGSPALLLPVQ